MKLRNSSHRACGFSLVEVMVALVVICIGLLGIAKMQALTLSSTTTSRQRALAALQAASLASAMHSNREYWAGFAGEAVQIVGNATAPAISGTPGATGLPIDAALQTEIANDLAAPPITKCIDNAGGAAAKCTASQLAGFDLARWWANSVTPLLPNPTAVVSCPVIPAGTLAPVSCTIQITWTEKAVGVNAQSAAVAVPGQFELPSYTLYVEP